MKKAVFAVLLVAPAACSTHHSAARPVPTNYIADAASGAICKDAAKVNDGINYMTKERSIDVMIAASDLLNDLDHGHLFDDLGSPSLRDSTEKLRDAIRDWNTDPYDAGGMGPGGAWDAATVWQEAYRHSACPS